MREHDQQLATATDIGKVIADLKTRLETVALSIRVLEGLQTFYREQAPGLAPGGNRTGEPVRFEDTDRRPTITYGGPPNGGARSFPEPHAFFEPPNPTAVNAATQAAEVARFDSTWEELKTRCNLHADGPFCLLPLRLVRHRFCGGVCLKGDPCIICHLPEDAPIHAEWSPADGMPCGDEAAKELTRTDNKEAPEDSQPGKAQN